MTDQFAPPSQRARLTSKLITFVGMFQRAMTLGVRGLVVDAQNRVLLVRHTYLPGFYLPGGGVERGETMLEALRRELEEEGNIRLEGAPELFGVYLNRRVSARDHVGLYLVRAYNQDAPRKPDYEIAQAEFFPLDALPHDTTGATRARIAEALQGATISPYW